MNDKELKDIVESLLMSSDKPLTIAQLQAVFDEDEKPESHTVKQVLEQLAADYQSGAIELKLLASGYCLQTRKQFSAWINRLYAEKPVKYSRALLETLAIIAYRQPVTRADIEEIRGVSLSSSVLRTLVERDWIRAAGQRDVPGKPSVYVTTRGFLDYFNLTSINQLPSLSIEEL